MNIKSTLILLSLLIVTPLSYAGGITGHYCTYPNGQMGWVDDGKPFDIFTTVGG